MSSLERPVSDHSIAEDVVVAHSAVDGDRVAEPGGVGSGVTADHIHDRGGVDRGVPGDNPAFHPQRIPNAEVSPGLYKCLFISRQYRRSDHWHIVCADSEDLLVLSILLQTFGCFGSTFHSLIDELH